MKRVGISHPQASVAAAVAAAARQEFGCRLAIWKMTQNLRENTTRGATVGRDAVATKSPVTARMLVAQPMIFALFGISVFFEEDCHDGGGTVG